MCGIVGAIAHRNVSNILITGLKRLVLFSQPLAHQGAELFERR